MSEWTHDAGLYVNRRLYRISISSSSVPVIQHQRTRSVMPMTQISLSGLETETDSVTSKASVSFVDRRDHGTLGLIARAQTLQDMANPSSTSNTHKDILRIIRKEEDHAMSLLAASPLLSGLFLAYANKAATLDGPSAPSPIDLEWTEMKALNDHLQEEVASLRARLEKETERAKMAEDCVEALRAQVSSVKDENRELETAVSDERLRSGAMEFEYSKYKLEAENTIGELRETVEKEAVSYPGLFMRNRMSHFTTITGRTSCLEPSYRGPASVPHPIEGGDRVLSAPPH